VAYFYSFARNEFKSSSQKLISVTSRQFADKIDGSFARSVETFNDWTTNDVFGLAIEFNTTVELGQEFEKWMERAPEFALVALVDESGVVLEAAATSSMATSAQTLTGSRLPALAALQDVDERQVVLVESETMDQLGAETNNSYLFFSPAYSSSGQRNGAVVAMLNWTEISSHVARCTEDFNDQGYSAARSIILYPGKRMVSSEGQTTELSQTSYAALDRWASEISEHQVGAIELDEGTMLVGWNGLRPPMLEADDSSDDLAPVMLSVIPESEVMARLTSQLWIVLALGTIGMILVGLVTFFVARRIATRVTRAASLARGMAEGDTSREVDIHGDDEIGTLGEAFADLTRYLKDMAGVAERIAANDLTVEVEPRSEHDTLGNSFRSMVLNLALMIRELGENSRSLVSSAGEIASSSDTMSRGAKEQTAQIGQVSVAIEEMAATIVESSRNAGEVTEASKSAADNATTGGQIVNETIQGMQRIAAVVRESAESITQLARSADQIGEIIGVIDDIADQTNLLALNAAIEAARAGEQGRGFAVVADEVRKLAERTGKATGEITGMIKGIQSETEAAVYSMETGIQEVDKGRDLADKAGASLTEIVNVSQRVQDMILQIATAAEEQSVAAEQIARNVDKVSLIAKESASGTEQSATAASEMSQQAESLRQMVAKFKLDEA
jgi:methyl-accepting chemotaxis protein